MRKYLLVLLVLSSGCRQNQSEVTSGTYFNLKGFFEKQRAHLATENPLVDKTVSKGSSSETKKLKIRDWESELAPFISSDINKPSWKDSYSVNSTPLKIRYTAKQPKLRTRIIEINKNAQNQIKSILVINQSENTLYSSAERLEYYPDSLYRIKKKQEVIFIGTNNYRVVGRIIK